MDVTNSYSDPRSGVHLQLNKSSSRQSSTFSCRQWSSNSLQGRFALAWAPAEEVGHGDSVTRWLEYLAICNKETSPVMSKVCQSRLAFCQIGNEQSKFCQRFVKFCQIGEISPNHVTLHGDDADDLE